jgi:hypothetical protein
MKSISVRYCVQYNVNIALQEVPQQRLRCCDWFPETRTIGVERTPVSSSHLLDASRTPLIPVTPYFPQLPKMPSLHKIQGKSLQPFVHDPSHHQKLRAQNILAPEMPCFPKRNPCAFHSPSPFPTRGLFDALTTLKGNEIDN